MDETSKSSQQNDLMQMPQVVRCSGPGVKQMAARGTALDQVVEHMRASSGDLFYDVPSQPDRAALRDVWRSGERRPELHKKNSCKINAQARLRQSSQSWVAVVRSGLRGRTDVMLGEVRGPHLAVWNAVGAVLGGPSGRPATQATIIRSTVEPGRDVRVSELGAKPPFRRRHHRRSAARRKWRKAYFVTEVERPPPPPMEEVAPTRVQLEDMRIRVVKGEGYPVP